ncbi:MAG: aminotransferase class V-fold PLP-dependent enzyme [Treponema sp.]|jgi:cysteine desulfurase|nr:aminotransferase class V-fold PLP-dependent enzyme [Treponema sp.]
MKILAGSESITIRHYFDWAATSPCGEAAAPAPLGNPSSKHAEGREAKRALEDARSRCAAVLKVPPETLYFTSGGTESNCITLFSCLLRKGRGRVICSHAEHTSIREGIGTLERMGRATGKIAVDETGRVSADNITKALEKYGDVRFAAVMSVKNETGAVTDMVSVRDAIRAYGGPPAHLHCDMVQAAGKIPVDIPLWGTDSAAISAHKIGGPRGIGLLYLRRPMDVLCKGGGQEGKIRGGTENVQGALALASCLERRVSGIANGEYAAAKTRWKKLTSSLAAMERCVIIPEERVSMDEDAFSPYILQAAFKGVPGEVMARALDDRGFAVSTGSACSSAAPGRPVLAAMGLDEETRSEGIRVSQGWTTTDEEIDLLLEAISEALKKL